MLGKLMKYDLKGSARYLLPIYAMVLILALLNRGVDALLRESSLANTASGLMMFLYVMLVIAAFAFTAGTIILRFYKNLLGDEGYLMFTLPVTTSANIFAKLFSAIIWVLACLVVFGLSLLLLTLTTINFPDLNMLIQKLAHAFSTYHINPFLLIAESFLLFLLAIAANILLIYLAMAIGQLANNQKLLAAIGSYIGLQFVLQIISVIIINVFSNNNLFRSMFDWINTLSPSAFSQTIMLSLLLFAILTCVVFFIPCKLLLEKKLNLA